MSDERNPHDNKPETRKEWNITRIAFLLVAIVLFINFAGQAATKLQQTSHTLASVDWGAMFNLGIFLIMASTAIKIAAQPFVTMLKIKERMNHHH